jgi:hypothetical protein
VLFLVHAPLVLLPDDPDEALELVDRAEVLLDERPFCRFCPTGYYVASARVCARAGETDRGWRFLERAQAGAGLWKGSGPWTAALAEARGELHAAEGEQAEADVLLRRAVESYAASGQRLHERRLRAALA